MKCMFTNIKKNNLKSNKTRMIKGLIAGLIALIFSSVTTSLVAQTLNASEAKELLKVSKANITIPELKQSYVMSDAYNDKSSGISYIYLQQTCQGIKVFNAIKTIAIKDGKLAYSSGRFVSQIDKKVTGSVPVIAPVDAILNAAASLKLSIPSNLTITQDLFAQNHKYIFSDGGIAREKIEVELLWVSTDDFNTVNLGWNVNIDDKNSADWWNVRINANDGSYIEKNNWTVTCNYSKLHNAQQATAINNKIEKSTWLRLVIFD